MNETFNPPAPSPGPSRVMLLSLWAGPNTTWHARIVGPDAQVHAFSSPLELARFVNRLGALPAPASADPAEAQGLR